jgi:hypothetical protein
MMLGQDTAGVSTRSRRLFAAKRLRLRLSEDQTLVISTLASTFFVLAAFF